MASHDTDNISVNGVCTHIHCHDFSFNMCLCIQGPSKKCIHTLTKENSMLYNQLL